MEWRAGTNIPSGANAHFFSSIYGTAEAMPFQNSLFDSSF